VANAVDNRAVVSVVDRVPAVVALALSAVLMTTSAVVARRRLSDDKRLPVLTEHAIADSATELTPAMIPRHSASVISASIENFCVTL